MMKKWCIVFVRELDGKDVIHIEQKEKPTREEAINAIRDEGYIFKDGYDEIEEIYEV
jgi:hypothetical protein